MSCIISDTVLVGVSGDPSAPFTVISPADGVYVDDCQPPSEPLYCPGVYYMERTQPSIQNIVTQLQPDQPCSDLGPIHLNIPCPTAMPRPTSTPCSELEPDVTCSSPTDGMILNSQSLFYLSVRLFVCLFFYTGMGMTTPFMYIHHSCIVITEWLGHL